MTLRIGLFGYFLRAASSWLSATDGNANGLSALSNVTTFTYDNVGNQATITDAKSQVITFTYNAGNQLTTRTYPDATTVTFTYSNVGLRTGMTDASGTTASSFGYASASGHGCRGPGTNIASGTINGGRSAACHAS